MGEPMPQILISEITRMRPGMNCIAGFLLEEQRMARPLNPQGELHWPDDTLARVGWQVGGLYDVTPTTDRSTRGLPHQREDYFIDPDDVRLIRTYTPAAARVMLRPTVSRTLAGIFNDELMENKYVEEGSDCQSLGAIELSTRQFGFNFSYGKLKCWLRAGEEWPRFTVTATELAEVQDEGGATALQQRIRRSRRAQIRIGLAHAWDGPEHEYDPKRCFVMVNGILPFD